MRQTLAHGTFHVELDENAHHHAVGVGHGLGGAWRQLVKRLGAMGVCHGAHPVPYPHCYPHPSYNAFHNAVCRFYHIFFLNRYPHTLDRGSSHPTVRAGPHDVPL